MIKSALRISYDGKKVKIKADDEGVLSLIEKDVIKEKLKNFRRFLLELYSNKPAEYVDYVKKIVAVIFSQIDDSYNINDAYIVLEDEPVSVDIFLNISGRKITLTMGVHVQEIHNILRIVKFFARLSRSYGGITVKLKKGEALNEFIDFLESVGKPELFENLREIYVDADVVDYLKRILDKMNIKKISVMRLIRSNNCFSWISESKNIFYIDIRGLNLLDRGIEFLDKLITLANHQNIGSVQFSTKRIRPYMGHILDQLNKIKTGNVIDLIIDDNKSLTIIMRHETAVFLVKYSEEAKQRASESFSELLSIIQKVFEKDISVELEIQKEEVSVKVPPFKDKVMIKKERNWENAIIDRINEFCLKIKGE